MATEVQIDAGGSGFWWTRIQIDSIGRGYVWWMGSEVLKVRWF